MDAIERAMRWFFTGRKAWVLWPVGIIGVVLAMTATGAMSRLLAGAFLIVVPLAWLVGLLGIGTRDHMNKLRATGHQLLRESGIPALWASLYTLPVWLISNGTVSLLWWLLVAYIEIERRSRSVRERSTGTSQVKQ
ncbi:MAG TPA: hypothetical protein VMH26_01185 [Burkholderiales bacterium]|nr:hypothetical protein [Burkholderiales bacterium]